MKLIYRILPFFILTILLYIGSGWAREMYFKGKQLVEIESARWEMDTIKSQLDFSFTFGGGDLRQFEVFIRRSFPDQVEEMMVDPWDEDYYYEYNPQSEVYFLQSAGPDGEFDNDDDLIITNKKDDEEMYREY